MDARAYVGSQVTGVIRAYRPLTTIPVVLTTLAIGVWALSLRAVDLTAMNDFGLISVLPPGAIIAPIMVILSYCITLIDRPASRPALYFHLVVLIFMLYGITAIVEDVPRFQSAWRHVGVAESIARTGQIDPTIDAYFNWPGFFVLNAIVTEVSGFKNVVSFLPWAPFVLNLLYLGPLVVILKAATSDERLIWFGALIFYLTNWVGQDYLSPQGFSYLLYLVIIAILLRWFAGGAPIWSVRVPRWDRLDQIACRYQVLQGWRTTDEDTTLTHSGSRQAALMLIVIMSFAMATMSHQLTPFLTVTAVMLLVVVRRCPARGLPILMVAVILTWITFMAEAYMNGHLAQLTGHVGQVSSTVDANFANRLGGSPDHTLVVRLRLATTMFVWLLAAVGGLRRLRTKHLDVSLILIAVAPFPFMIAQPYGGEMLLRVYLFALPAMAFFAAATFAPAPAIGRSWQAPLMVGVLCIGLFGTFLVARYGNERMDYFTQAEVEAVQHVYDVAEPDSLLISPTGNLPWKFQDYEKHHYLVLTNDDDWVAMNATSVDVDSLVPIMASPRYSDAFLIITRSQYAHAEMFGILPPGFLKDLERDLQASPKFRLIYSNADASVYALAGD